MISEFQTRLDQAKVAAKDYWVNTQYTQFNPTRATEARERIDALVGEWCQPDAIPFDCAATATRGFGGEVWTLPIVIVDIMQNGL